MYILTALWHSFLLYFLSHAFIGSNIISADGREGGWLVLGNSIYTVSLFVFNYRYPFSILWSQSR
jgi:hypothetical protein